MKRFYKNSLCFFILFVFAIVGTANLSTIDPCKTILANWTESEMYFGGGPDEIIPYIEKAQCSDGTTKLIIGDSVCRQMFDDLQGYNSDFTIIGSNGAITMSGQYILAKEYLDNHPDATDVFLIVLPESMGRTFDTTWGYQYAVMPFVETGTIDELDDETVDKMGRAYGRLFLDKRVEKLLYLSAVNRKLYLNLLAQWTQGYKPSYYFELSDQYVMKMADLCKDRGVNFYLYPCPVCENKERSVEALKEKYANSKTYEINPDFLNAIQFYPADQANDGVHFSGDYANQKEYNNKIRQMYSGDVLMEYLILEEADPILNTTNLEDIQ